MPLKTYNPTSPSRRQLIVVDNKDLHKGKPYKILTVGLRKSGGRNNKGKMTVPHRGGGHKKKV